MRIGDISTVKGGKRVPKGYSLLDNPTSHIYIRVTNMKENTLIPDKLKYISDEIFQTIKNYVINKDDLYLTIAGTIGEAGIVPTMFNNMNLTENAVKLTNIQINKSFLLKLLQSPAVQYQFHQKTNKVAQPKLAIERILSTYIPLPPLKEQERIVSRIATLDPFVDDYDQAETELSALNNSFPEQIKKSILQYAIQGKLVPQDPKDEPASVLLENIKTEKQKLIKAGKIKKDKVESYIYKRDNRHYEKIGNKEVDITDEIPFEIPDSWAWVRLGDIALINPKNECKDTLLASFIPMNLLEGGYCNNYQYECRSWEEIKKGFTHFAQEDIVVAKITPCFQNRKSAILYKLQGELGAGTTELHVVRCVQPLTPEYIFWTFKTEHFITQGIKNFTGTAGQQRISSSFIKNYLIPLPPQKEQQRIVTRIGQLFKTLS